MPKLFVEWCGQRKQIKTVDVCVLMLIALVVFRLTRRVDGENEEHDDEQDGEDADNKYEDEEGDDDGTSSNNNCLPNNGEDACPHCGLQGSSQHRKECPRRPCGGCGIHPWPTVFEEPAGSLMTELNPGEQLRISPRRVKFCQDSISRFFHDGTSVFDFPQDIPKISACFHQEYDGTRLFALNNRTLFNAIHTNVDEIIVNIVKKPSDWPRRFTGSRPWMCVKVRGSEAPLRAYYSAAKLPASAFPGGGHRSLCLVVLEARNLVNSKKDTLVDLLKDMSPDLDVQPVVGPRAFARVRVNESDVPLIKRMIKAIAERMGKNVRAVDCFEVDGLRLYESPRGGWTTSSRWLDYVFEVDD